MAKGVSAPRAVSQSSEYHPLPTGGFFIFFIFYFRFLQKYIFILKIYRNIPPPPRCWAAGIWSPRCGAAGAFLQKFSWRICTEAPRGPVSRQRGGRPPRPPGSGATATQRPPALVCFTKNSEKKFSVCHNTIHITYNGLTVHLYCKSVLAL